MLESLDYDAAERVEAELDSFIEKRAREKEDANRVEELWTASEARHRERRRRENQEAWHGFHCHMERLHSALSAEHRERAEALAGRGKAC